MRTLALVLFIASSCACAATPPAQATKPSVAVAPAPNSTERSPARKPPPGVAFGGERWGFVEASSINGRLVVLRRFQGNAVPTFAHHGESSVPTDVAVFDTVLGTERPIEEIIAIDPTRRWLLVLAKGLLLGDGESGEFVELRGADLEQDSNSCLDPRQATFSIKGARVAWILRGSNEVRIRELSTGQEWTVAGDSRIWRAWPEDVGRGATLMEVPAKSRGWPAQNTSCACRWCKRFAASFGFYGWAGPAFTIAHVDDAGTRSKVDEPPSSEAPSHGPSDGRCTLEPSSVERPSLERGPWRWQCP